MKRDWTTNSTGTLACFVVALVLAAALLLLAGAPAWGAGGFGSVAYLVMAHGLSK